ncbi:MAG: carbohydrate ABC transporter permease [Desulfobacteraceae bacterium]|nr:carbohydrate ABC transporter permease [Desulfobacteraceae bacterium]MBC2753757.1 carbohydrate ABC transporter permease [Desulfobacteraceae bacterium]
MSNGSRIAKRIRSTLFYIGALALCLPPVFVFVWMILTGLKTGVQNISYPPQFIFSPTLENFRAVFAQYNFFKYLMNSLIVAGLATGLSLLLGLPAAYSIAKYRQGRIGILILVARMTPFVSYLLPWYIIFRYLDLIDTYTALTITHLIITLPMVIWLMISFFESVPAELEDAAMIDGCSSLQSFRIIVLPLVRNGIATSAIISFIFSWNQFLFSLILSGPKTKTVPVAVYNFISYGKIDWAGIGAAATLIVLPVSIFAFFVRKSIVQGLTMGALKD